MQYDTSGQHLDWGNILIGVGFRDAHGVRYNSGYTQVYITLESTIESIRIYSSHK